MSNMKHGIDESFEQEAEHLHRNIESLGKRLLTFLKRRELAVFYFAAAVALWFYPALIDPVVAFGLLFASINLLQSHRLPHRLPKSSGMKDPSEPDPGSGKTKPAQGIAFLGNDLRSGEEVWLTNNDCRQHFLDMGTTGSGKSQGLMSFAGVNSLLYSSGMTYIEGKGSVDAVFKIISMARRMGREDDILVVNFMTGNRDVADKSSSRLSNTLNPFANGSSSSLTELVVGMMSDGKSDIWGDRAQSFVAALIRVLVYMRDQGEIQMYIGEIREYLDLNQLLDTATREDLPTEITDGLNTYLRSLPGMTTEMIASRKFTSTVYDQHGYITMQLIPVLNLLADSYGHIFKASLGDVDFLDVVMNRRILIVLLPALEKAEASLMNLGKIIMNSLRGMMGATLPAELEGDTDRIVNTGAATINHPYFVVCDEFGYYIVKGSAIMSAQGRGLGFSMIFAGQDYPSFKKASPEEAAAIVATTVNKVCRKLEDPGETLEIFVKSAGEAVVSETQGFQRNTNSSYKDGGSVSMNRRSRISVRDLRNLGVGEAYYFIGDKVIPVKSLYAEPDTVKTTQLNVFLQIRPPMTEEEVARREAKAIANKEKTQQAKDVADQAAAMTQQSNNTQQLIKHNIKEYGWHCLAVSAGETTAEFSYTIGLMESYQHPELILVGLNADIAHDRLNQYVAYIREGKRIINETGLTELIWNSIDVQVRQLTDDGVSFYMGVAKHYYKHKKIDALILHLSE